MNRKLKAMGLALFAAFAFSAIGAQAASADLFVSDVTDTVFTSTEDEQHHFVYAGNKVVCGITNFTGTEADAESTELTVTPTYDECTFGGTPAEVRTNHCDYTFTSHTVEGDAPVHVECPEGEHIEIEVPGFGHCLMTVAPQTTGGGVAYKDGTQPESSKEEVTVKVTATVDVVRDKTTNFFCSLIASEGTGTYTGSSWIQGYKYVSGPSTEFTEDTTAETAERGTTHWTWVEGEQVNIGADTG